MVCDFSRPFTSQGAQATHEEVRAAYANVAGEPLADGECLWASSFTDASALVRKYRKGGVFLVGDSAHTHLPAGGQVGVGVSIQDAVNLGWKLAAVAQGRAPDSSCSRWTPRRWPSGRTLVLAMSERRCDRRCGTSSRPRRTGRVRVARTSSSPTTVDQEKSWQSSASPTICGERSSSMRTCVVPASSEPTCPVS
ncbi:FAD-dependent monooxygenase [Saccharothrix isguenensis]